MAFISLAACTIVVLFFHEAGHVISARVYGIEVDRVSIGLGPELAAATDRRGTRWRFALWPVGAYTIYRCGGTEGEKYSPTAPSRLAALVILAAGPVANLVLAGLVLSLVWIGGYPMDGNAALNEPLPAFAFLLSGLSCLMGAFNLLPLPPLDGWLLTKLALGYDISLWSNEKKLRP